MMDEYGLDRAFPLAAVVSLVMTFNTGIIVERLSGISTGHVELLDMDRPLARIARGGETVMTTTEAHTRQPCEQSRRAPATPTSPATSSATA